MKVDITRMRFKDWKEVEQVTGKKMGWFMQQAGTGFPETSADEFEILVWVAGKRDNPSFSREEASELGPMDLVGAEDPT